MSKSPDAFRTISEVAEWLEVQAHVLRFWESKFTQVKPVKRAGGRRYYRPADMLLLGGIRKLLHDDGMSIKEVQAILRDLGIGHVSEMSHSLESAAPGDPSISGDGGHQDQSGADAASGAAPQATSEESAADASQSAAQPPADETPPLEGQMDAPSENQAFFHQDELESDPSAAAQEPAPAPDTGASDADLTAPEITEPGVDSALESAESDAPDQTPDPASEGQAAAAEPEQIMMDLGAPEADTAPDPLAVPDAEDLPAPEASLEEAPAPDVDTTPDLSQTAEPLADDSPAPMDADLASPPELTADSEPAAEPVLEADADLAWQRAMDADATAAPEAEAAAPAADDPGAFSAAIEPAPEDAPPVEALDDTGSSDPATDSKPRIISVADEDLAAQVSLRPGILTLLSQATEIAPEARAEVAACAEELHAWLDAH
ncbi:MerR family transcriptional regulator [Phaeobacter sp. QD34_3]|uniref:MerR family transcriptional regulator n=1 Tax=unclassified Phaeobacter TaxID=2621772 RepID=UPI00237F95AE|nr:MULTISPECIES: MerR family transcriptional regulator [unclassified Phaeobacter]MDE4134179.1 MerR family transcriptional regulator [Phaeobacter sp. QD34_3]MDE4137898.1 MerR family transcriptional regulator [Phaeobacter sp. QD34_24]